MSLVTLGGLQVDDEDPCALYQALYAVKLRLISGEMTEEVEIRSPVTNRRVRFSAGNLDALDTELRTLAAACDARSGRRRRFAISGGFRPY